VRRQRRRWSVRIAVAAALTLVTIAALGVSVVLHAQTSIGHAAAEHFMEWTGSEASRGTVRIGRVRSIPPGDLSLLDYRVIAPNGEVVIASDEIGGRFDPSGLLDGQVRFRPSWFVRSRIRLTPGPRGQINLVHASEVPEDRTTMPLVFQDIRLIDNTIYLALPGKPAVTMRHVYGLADVHIGHFWQWRMDNNRGEVDLRPFAHPGFRQMSGRVRSDHAHPLVVRLVLDLEVAEPVLAMDYYVPRMAGEEGSPHFDLDLGESIDGHGVDATEEQEEVSDRLRQAREALASAIREEREEREDGELDDARAMQREIVERRRTLRQAEREARARGRDEDGPSEEADEQGVRREDETASEDEQENVAAIARRERRRG
jgi:hypothetical protein